MKWVLLYLVIGILLNEICKIYGKKEYETLISEFPTVEPYIAIIMSVFWFPLLILAIFSIFDEKNQEE